MAFEIEFDFTELLDAIKQAPEAVAEGAATGLHAALYDWQKDAVDLAPQYVKKGPKDRRPPGTLRSSFSTDVKEERTGLIGEIAVTAVDMSKHGARYNYAYYLHEVHPKKHGNKFANPSTPGTVPQFLDTAAKGKENEWRRMIEKEIDKNLKEVGW